MTDNIIDDKRLDRYFHLTESALEKLEIAVPEKTHLHAAANDYLNMAKSYVNDAKHFREQGKYCECFAALNYAHGWLDAGARIGIFDVEYDDFLFTVDSKE